MMNQGQVPSYKGRVPIEHTRNSLRATHTGGSDCLCDSRTEFKRKPIYKGIRHWSASSMLKICALLLLMFFEVNALLKNTATFRLTLRKSKGLKKKLFGWSTYKLRDIRASLDGFGNLLHFTMGKTRFQIKSIDNAVEVTDKNYVKRLQREGHKAVRLRLTRYSKDFRSTFKGNMTDRFLVLDEHGREFLRMCKQFSVHSIGNWLCIDQDNHYPLDGLQKGDYIHSLLNRRGSNYTQRCFSFKTQETGHKDPISSIQMRKNRLCGFGAKYYSPKNIVTTHSKETGNLLWFQFQAQNAAGQKKKMRWQIKEIKKPDSENSQVKLVTTRHGKSWKSMKAKFVSFDSDNTKRFLEFCRRHNVPSEDNWLEHAVRDESSHDTSKPWYNGRMKAFHAPQMPTGNYLHAIFNGRTPIASRFSIQGEDYQVMDAFSEERSIVKMIDDTKNHNKQLRNGRQAITIFGSGYHLFNGLTQEATVFNHNIEIGREFVSNHKLEKNLIGTVIGVETTRERGTLVTCKFPKILKNKDDEKHESNNQTEQLCDDGEESKPFEYSKTEFDDHKMPEREFHKRYTIVRKQNAPLNLPGMPSKPWQAVQITTLKKLLQMVPRSKASIFAENDHNGSKDNVKREGVSHLNRRRNIVAWLKSLSDEFSDNKTNKNTPPCKVAIFREVLGFDDKLKKDGQAILTSDFTCKANGSKFLKHTVVKVKHMTEEADLVKVSTKVPAKSIEKGMVVELTAEYNGKFTAKNTVTIVEAGKFKDGPITINEKGSTKEANIERVPRHFIQPMTTVEFEVTKSYLQAVKKVKPSWGAQWIAEENQKKDNPITIEYVLDLGSGKLALVNEDGLQTPGTNFKYISERDCSRLKVKDLARNKSTKMDVQVVGYRVDENAEWTLDVNGKGFEIGSDFEVKVLTMVNGGAVSQDITTIKASELTKPFDLHAEKVPIKKRTYSDYIKSIQYILTINKLLAEDNTGLLSYNGQKVDSIKIITNKKSPIPNPVTIEIGQTTKTVDIVDLTIPKKELYDMKKVAARFTGSWRSSKSRTEEKMYVTDVFGKFGITNCGDLPALDEQVFGSRHAASIAAPYLRDCDNILSVEGGSGSYQGSVIRRIAGINVQNVNQVVEGSKAKLNEAITFTPEQQPGKKAPKTQTLLKKDEKVTVLRIHDQENVTVRNGEGKIYVVKYDQLETTRNDYYVPLKPLTKPVFAIGDKVTAEKSYGMNNGYPCGTIKTIKEQPGYKYTYTMEWEDPAKLLRDDPNGKDVLTAHVNESKVELRVITESKKDTTVEYMSSGRGAKGSLSHESSGDIKSTSFGQPIYTEETNDEDNELSSLNDYRMRGPTGYNQPASQMRPSRKGTAAMIPKLSDAMSTSPFSQADPEPMPNTPKSMEPELNSPAPNMNFGALNSPEEIFTNGTRARSAGSKPAPYVQPMDGDLLSNAENGGPTEISPRPSMSLNGVSKAKPKPAQPKDGHDAESVQEPSETDKTPVIKDNGHNQVSPPPPPPKTFKVFAKGTEGEPKKLTVSLMKEFLKINPEATVETGDGKTQLMSQFIKSQGKRRRRRIG